MTSDAPHCFTETLPRQHGDTGECLECERPYDSHEGPPTGRRFDYSTRDIAFALMEIGKGASDRITGWRVRDRAERLRTGKSARGRYHRNKDGNTVADWVELFAPPIFESLAPTAWPRVVAIDALPLAVKTKSALGAPKQGGKIAFNVLAAHGWENRGEPGKLLALSAAPNFGLNQGFGDWVSFLTDLRDRLSGPLPAFVSDSDQTIRRALDHVFPPGLPGSPVIFLCHFHLGRSVEEKLLAAGVGYGDPLLEMLAHVRKATCGCAFCEPSRWGDFDAAARGRKFKPVTNWLNKSGGVVAWQLANRSRLTLGHVAIGPLETHLTTIEGYLRNRRGMIHNRERLNRRLMLMQMDLNQQASMSHYSKIIRDELLGNGGFGAARYVVDDKRGSSLRIY